MLRRLFQEKDCISIYDKDEAIKGRWITEDEKRIWVVPSDQEKTPTFVWGFDNLDSAIIFYEILRTSELGIKCDEI